MIFSCKSANSVPSGVLPVNSMKEVMWDVMMADEYVNLMYAKDSTLNVKKETLKLYSKVFALHDVSSEEFGNSYVFYKKNTNMEKILLDSLQVYGAKTRENYNMKIPFELQIMQR